MAITVLVEFSSKPEDTDALKQFMADALPDLESMMLPTIANTNSLRVMNLADLMKICTWQKGLGI